MWKSLVEAVKNPSVQELHEENGSETTLGTITPIEYIFRLEHEMKLLQKQAQEAEENGRNSVLQTCADRIITMEQQEAKLRERIKTLESENSKCQEYQTRIDMLETQNLETERKLREATINIDRMAVENSESMRQSYERICSDFNLTKTKQKELENALLVEKADYQKMKNQFFIRIETLESRLKLSETELNTCKEEEKLMKRRLDLYQEEIASLKEKCHDQENSLKEKQTNISLQNSQLTGLLEKITGMDSDNTKLQKEISQLSQEKTKLQMEYDKLLSLLTSCKVLISSIISYVPDNILQQCEPLIENIMGINCLPINISSWTSSPLSSMPGPHGKHKRVDCENCIQLKVRIAFMQRTIEDNQKMIEDRDQLLLTKYQFTHDNKEFLAHCETLSENEKLLKRKIGELYKIYENLRIDHEKLIDRIMNQK